MTDTTDSTVEISERESDGCVVLDIRAENFTYPQTAILKSTVSRYLEKGKRLFVLNMNDVRVVDSYGLATIVSALKMIKERGGGLALYGLNDLFTHLVEVTHLDRVLEVWPSEAQATYYLTTNAKGTTTL